MGFRAFGIVCTGVRQKTVTVTEVLRAKLIGIGISYSFLIGIIC